MATKTLDILIRARDEASRTFQKVGVAGKTASAELTAAGTTGGKGFTTGVTKETATLGSKLKSQFASLGPLLGVTLGAGLFKASLDAATEAQKVNATLETSLKRLGATGTAAFAGVVDWADKLQFQTGIDDEQIKTISARLAGMGTEFFKAVGPNAEKALEQLTLGLVDMAAATGKSTQMLMRSLGPAVLNTPEKAIPLLQKLGVLTDAQAEKIKNLAEQGQKTVATQEELDAITAKFGGTAESTATASEKMKVLFGEIEETIGKALIPVLKLLNQVLTPIFEVFSSLPGPIQSVVVGFGLAAGAIKLFGGSVKGVIGDVVRLVGRIIGLTTAQGAATVASEALAVAETEATVSTDALAVSQGAATASSGRLAVAEGAAAAGGTAAAASTGGFAASLAKLGPIAVIAGAAIFDVAGAVKIYNAQQDTNTANAHARASSYRAIALEIAATAIQTGRLTRRQADQIILWRTLRERGLATKGVLQQLKDVQESLDARVKEGRISFGTYARIIRQTGLNMNVTAGQAGSLAGSLDAGAAAANRLARQLAKVPFGLGGFFQPFIPAAQGFHGSVSQPTLFLAGEGGSSERVDIGPSGGGGGGSPSRSTVLEVKPDRRRFVQADNYELRYGGA